jgi:hypothetical protein
MKPSRILLAAAALSVAACSDDDGDLGVVEPGEMAMVRFINAVPDTGAVTLRFVDRVENLPTFVAVPFRGGSGLYQGVAPGARPTRVFPLATTVAGASTRLVDTTLTLESGRRYTILYAGRTLAGNTDPAADRLVLIADDVPSPGASNVALRVIHAAVGTGPVDVFLAKAGANAITSPAVTPLRNVAYLGQSAYLTLPTRPRVADSLYTITVTGAGSTTALFSSTPNEPGAPVSNSISAQAGVQIANSALTAVIFPGATAGTRAATTTNTTAAAEAFLDNVPAVP